MTDIASNLNEIRKDLPANAKLVAVSKFHPISSIKAAYDAGQRIFGESREQELRQKVEALPKDIEWHFIGHLQTNKVKYIVPYISLIESVDSLKLLVEIICGLMTIASNVDDLEQVACEFDEADSFFTELKSKYFAAQDSFCQKSWGMSHDYRLALEHGSTMVRIGTSIFGERQY